MWYVIDATDSKRMSINEEILTYIVTDPLIRNWDFPICLLINKIDEVKDSQIREKILEFIGFNSLKLLNPQIKWFVQETIATKKHGIEKCLKDFEDNIPSLSEYFIEE